MTSDDDLRDHFERQYARGGPTADIARAVLDLIDERDMANKELEEIPEIIGDVRAAAKRLEIFESLIEWAKQDVTFSEFGDLDEDTLERFARAYERHERISDDVSTLAIEAGLLPPRDYETDPLPLIRMFLPVD